MNTIRNLNQLIVLLNKNYSNFQIIKFSYEEAYEAPPAHHHPYHQHEIYSHVHRQREYRYEAPAATEYQHTYRETYPGNSSTNFYPSNNIKPPHVHHHNNNNNNNNKNNNQNNYKNH